MHLAAGLVLVVAYLALSINSYLETQALGRFSLGYGRLGPTEARIGLMALLVVVACGVEVSVLGLTLLDVVALGGAVVMVLALGCPRGREPPRPRRARALCGEVGPAPSPRRPRASRRLQRSARRGGVLLSSR